MPYILAETESKHEIELSTVKDTLRELVRKRMHRCCVVCVRERERERGREMMTKSN